MGAGEQSGPSAVSIGTTVRLRGLDGRHGRLADAWGEPRAVSRAVEGPSPGQLLAIPPPTELELNVRRLSARGAKVPKTNKNGLFDEIIIFVPEKSTNGQWSIFFPRDLYILAALHRRQGPPYRRRCCSFG